MARFARAYRRQLQAADKANVDRAVTGNEEPEPLLRHTLTKPGDTRRLRGIPAIGRGVTGAIPGSRPGDNLR